MTVQSSFDRDGNPRTGFVPVRTIANEPASTLVAERVSAVRGRFQTEVDTGALNQLRKTYRFADGSSVAASFMFGTYTFQVTLPPPPKEPEGEFFGGILIQPKYHLDETGFIGYRNVSTFPYPAPDDAIAVRSSVAEIAAASTKRPVVPGTPEGESPDWLIIQIAKNKKLTATSIASGAARVLRIKNPEFGPYAEIPVSAGQYLLSADLSFTEFFLCGRKVLSIPSFNYAAFVEAPLSQAVRLHTVGLRFSSFETAHLAEGIILLAFGENLFVVDTEDRSPGGEATWKLLASAPYAARMNSYGTEFSDVRVENVQTVTCFGTNGAGACSGFSVRIELTPDGRVITGSVSPRYQTWLEAVPSETTFSHRITLDYQSTVTSSEVRISAGDPDLLGTAQLLTSGGASTASYRFTNTIGRPAVAPDTVLGGYMPFTPAQTTTVQLDQAKTGSSSGTRLFSDPGIYPEEYEVGYSDNLVLTGSLRAGGIDEEPFDVSFAYSRNVAGFPGDEVTTVTQSGSLVTFEGEYPQSPATKSMRVAADGHADRMVLQSLQNNRVSYTSSPAKDISNSPWQYLLGTGPLPPPQTPTSTPGALCSAQIVRAGGAVVYEWRNLWDFFPVLPPAALPSTGSPTVLNRIPLPGISLSGGVASPVAGSPPTTSVSTGISGAYLENAFVIGQYATPFFGAALEAPGQASGGPGGSVIFTAAYDYSVSHPSSEFPSSGSKTFTMAEYISQYPITDWSTPWGEGPAYALPDQVQIALGLESFYSKHGNAAGTGSSQIFQEVRDVLYSDMRTGGFIAQLHHKVSNVAPQTDFVIADLVVGNDRGAIPLKTLIDEWIDLDTRTTPAGRTFFIDRAPIVEVALI